jgi:hypothetical protein
MSPPLTSWSMLCALLLIPATAVAHHLVFFPHKCMLEGFGDDYTARAVADWLSHDPSLLCAAVAVFALYYLGRHRPWVRRVAAPAFISTLPVSIWIWDIPFSHRSICSHFHDGRLSILLGVPVSTKSLYMLSATVYAAILLIANLRRAHQVVREDAT